MRKLLSAIFTACFWISLLALVVAGVARIGIEAMEQRSEHQVSRLR